MHQCVKFKDGLRGAFQTIVSAFLLYDFSKLVVAPYRVEEHLNKQYGPYKGK